MDKMIQQTFLETSDKTILPNSSNSVDESLATHVASWSAHEATLRALVTKGVADKKKLQAVEKLRAKTAANAMASPRAAWLAAKSARYAWNSVKNNLDQSEEQIRSKAYAAAYSVLKLNPEVLPQLGRAFESLKLPSSATQIFSEYAA